MIVIAAAAGAIAGAASGVIPGLHVNTFAALALAFGGIPGLANGPVATGFLAAGVAATFTSLAAGTFLGAPPEEAIGTALPAHRMLLDGRGVEAVDLAAAGALAGSLAGLLLALPLAHLVAPPIHLGDHARAALPVILVAIIAFTILTERRRVPYRPYLVIDPFHGRATEGIVARAESGSILLEDGRRLADPVSLRPPEVGTRIRVRVRRVWTDGPASRSLGRLLAFLVFLLAGAYGWASLRHGATSPFGIPSSVLLPVFAGLFGIPGLVPLALRTLPIPPQIDVSGPAPTGILKGAGIGSLASILLALVPGLSPSHASAMALGTQRSRDAESTIFVLGACAGAGVVMSLLALPLLGRARSGSAVTADALAPMTRWGEGAVGQAAAAFLLTLAIGALVGWLAARAAARAFARLSNRVRTDRLAWGAILWIAVITGVFAGWMGLVILGVGALVGALPVILRVRRSHVMGVILLPLLARIL